MAWYAWYKRVRSFRIAPYIHWIREYKNILAKEWWDSLSVEEQEKLKAEYEAEKEANNRKAMNAAYSLCRVMSMMSEGTRMRLGHCLDLYRRLM